MTLDQAALIDEMESYQDLKLSPCDGMMFIVHEQKPLN